MGYNEVMPENTPPGNPQPRPKVDLTAAEDTVIAPKARVVFFDDDQTPVDFVMHLLETYLGFEEPKARKAVETIRVAGRCIVGELLPAVARSTVQRMQAAAQAKGYPFRMEVQEGDGR